MAELVPIRVKIRHGIVDGRLQHVYPRFNLLDPSVRGDMDWSYFIDQAGTGWHYDKLSGIGETDAENPDPDVWWGCIAVPKPFAVAAVARFPDDVETLTEAEFEAFYDQRAHAHESELQADSEALSALKAREDLGEDVSAEKAAALDPDDPTPGVRRNTSKTWAGYKAKRKIAIDKDFAKAEVVGPR